jgi:PleD family two-component response regulator
MLLSSIQLAFLYGFKPSAISATEVEQAAERGVSETFCGFSKIVFLRRATCAECGFEDSGRTLAMALVVEDVTELKSLEERLGHRALHDPLTRLPNRTLFSDRLEHALSRAERHGSEVAVLFLDLDNFKLVNYSLGHEAGDRLLVGASGRISSCLGPWDTAAYLSGDEFAVLVEVTTRDRATRVARRFA